MGHGGHFVPDDLWKAAFPAHQKPVPAHVCRTRQGEEGAQVRAARKQGSARLLEGCIETKDFFFRLC